MNHDVHSPFIPIVLFIKAITFAETMYTLSEPDLRHHHFGHTLGKLDILGHVHFHELLRIECVGQSYGGFTYKDMWYRWPWYVFMLLRSSPFEEECSLCRTHEQVSLTQLRLRVRGLESDNFRLCIIGNHICTIRSCC